MGYETQFEGNFKIDRPLDATTKKRIDGLCTTRRMGRDLTKLGMSKEQAQTYGDQGEFYMEGIGFKGQEKDASVFDQNKPPRTQPGLWCNWMYNEKSCTIEWNGQIKFYEHVEWIVYLVNSILKPKGYVLNGEVKWQGEKKCDHGVIIMQNNTLVISY